jgi:hypothetical protein
LWFVLDFPPLPSQTFFFSSTKLILERWQTSLTPYMDSNEWDMAIQPDKILRIFVILMHCSNNGFAFTLTYVYFINIDILLSEKWLVWANKFAECCKIARFSLSVKESIWSWFGSL